jgi:hypothetical protein
MVTSSKGGNSFGAAVTIGANDSFGINLETAGTTRFSIDNTGAGLMNGTLAVAGNFTVNTDKLTVDTTTGAVNIGASNTAGTLTLGRTSSANSTIDIGTVAGNTFTQTVNIGTSATAGSTSNVTIGSTVAGTTIVQGAARLSALTTNGFVKTSGGNGALSVSTSVALGSEVSGTLGLSNGGTNASLTASNGGIVYSNASQLQILAGTATANQCLLSGSNAAPSWGSCSTGGLVQVPTSNTAGAAGANVVSPTAASITGMTINGTTNGTTAATALIVNQGNAITAVNGAEINLTNSSGTQTNGMLINRSTAGGTTTSLLNLTNTAGTATNGIIFNGTITNDITTAAARALTVRTGNNGAGASGATTVSTGTGTTSTGALNLTTGNASAGTAGNITLDVGTSTAGAPAINIGTAASTAARTITIGGTAQTGAITLGQATTAQTVSILSANATTGVQSVNIANGTTGANTTVSILSGVGTAGTGTLNLGNNTRVATIDIGNIAPAAARTITLGGGNSAVVDTINIGSGNTSVAGGKTINIGSGTPTGTNLITIGSNANVASTTTIQGGNGATALVLRTAANGTVAIQNTGLASTVQIGNTTGAVAQTINIGNNATASSTTSMTIGNLLGASATTIQAGTGNLNLTTNSASASVVVRSNTNSATAFNVQNAGGDSLLKVDTANGRVMVGDDPGFTGAKARLYFGDYGVGSNVWIGEQSTTDTDTLQLQGKEGIYLTVSGAPTNVFTLDPSGSAEFQSISNGNAVFRVNESSSGVAILNIDTNAGGAASTGYVINNGISNIENELQNPGFEMSSTDDGTSTGWFGTGITATNARTGNNSYSLTGQNDSSEVKWHPVQPGDVIYFEGWVKRDVAATGTGGFFVKAVDQNFANTVYSTGDVWTDPGTTYTLRTNSYTVPAGKYYVQFVTTVRSGATGTWYFDDVFMNIANKRTPTIFKNSVNSTTAFQVQNAAGTNLFGVSSSEQVVSMPNLLSVNANGGSGLYVDSVATGTSFNQAGATFTVTAAPSSASNGSYAAIASWASTTSANLTNGLLYGVNGQAANEGTGTVGYVYGGQLRAYNTTTGIITHAAGLNVQVRNASTGTITNAYGISVASPANLGTITNNYGIYVENFITGTNRYPLYLDGASTPLLTVQSTGSTTFRNQTDSGTAFTVLNATGDSLFNVDTSSFYVINNGTRTFSNDLENPSFEAANNATNRAGGWNTDANGYYSTSNPRTGNSNYEILASASVNRDYETWKSVPVNTGETWYLEGYVKRASGASGTGGFYLSFYDKDWANQQFVNGTWTDPGTSYTLRSITATVPSCGPNPCVYMAVDLTTRAGGSGAWHFDDLYLTRSSQQAPYLFKNSVNSTTAFRVQNVAGNTLLNVDTTTARGFVSVALGNTASTNAVCSSLANATAPTANTAYELRDCSAAPAADYAEMYPVTSGVEYGDIVAVGTEMVNTYDETDGNIDWNKVKGQVTRLVKSTSSYQSNVIGIVSNNYGDFTSAGHNIKEEDNPMPVALNGRVPVKISATSDPIEPGDYITTSVDSGKAIKAGAAGTVIGKALEAWDPLSGKTTIMVYVEQGYYPGPPLSTVLQGASLDVSGSAVINGNTAVGGSLNVSGGTTLNDLTVNGNTVFNGNLSVQNITVANITINGHIITAGNTPTATIGTGAGTADLPNNIPAPQVTIEGNDTSGTITIVAGANTVDGELAKVTFTNPFGAKPRIVFSPANRDSAKLGAYYDSSLTTNNSFSIMADQAPQAGKTYTFTYFIVE